jgi:hypothetical protein
MRCRICHSTSVPMEEGEFDLCAACAAVKRTFRDLDAEADAEAEGDVDETLP